MPLYGETIQPFVGERIPMGKRSRIYNERWIYNGSFTTLFAFKVVPAVKLGILETGLKWEDLLKVRYAV